MFALVFRSRRVVRGYDLLLYLLPGHSYIAHPAPDTDCTRESFCGVSKVALMYLTRLKGSSEGSIVPYRSPSP